LRQAVTNIIDFVVSKAVPLLACLVSVVAVIISGLAYYHNTEDAIRMAKIDSSIRTVLYRTIILWEQTDTVVQAQVKNFTVDPYVYPSMRDNSRLLTSAMDAAIETGGLDKLIGKDKHALDMYIAFVQGLQQQAQIRTEADVALSEWTKQHVLFGLIRQLDNLLDYPGSGVPQSVIKRIKEEIAPLQNEAHNYLEK
jgi:hypothetical protein